MKKRYGQGIIITKKWNLNFANYFTLLEIFKMSCLLECMCQKNRGYETRLSVNILVLLRQINTDHMFNLIESQCYDHQYTFLSRFFAWEPLIWNVLNAFINSLVKVIYIYIVLYVIRNLWIFPKSGKSVVFVSCFRDFSGQMKLKMISRKK